MAIDLVIATLSTPGSTTDWLEFDIDAPKSFSVHVTGDYQGRLTLRVRTRETNAVVNSERFKDGDEFFFEQEIVSKQDVCMCFRDGDYKSGSADIVIQFEGH